MFANSKQKIANGFEVTILGMFPCTLCVYAHGLFTKSLIKNIYIGSSSISRVVGT